MTANGMTWTRSDVEGETHTREYFKDGRGVIQLAAIPDVDRVGKWQVSVRWNRRDKWHLHGWGPCDSEADAVSMIDAVGIGVEAAVGGTAFICGEDVG